MADNTITSMRDVLRVFQDECIVIDNEVDPIYEIAGIQKALDNSYPLLFNSIKGYPSTRVLGNVFSRADRTARIFNVADPRQLKFKCVDAMKHPLPPKVVGQAPCQEVVITDNIDVMQTLPILKHTARDGARVLTGGVYFLSGDNYLNSMDVAYRRTNFRGKDWAAVWITPSASAEKVLTTQLRGKRVDLTVNICNPPAVEVTASAHFMHPVVPLGTNEIALAGALQGSPIDVVRAKTVDAYAIANSEWVLEGYINVDERTWETDEAEAVGTVAKRGMAPPYFPEWHGYLGRAGKVFKLHVTAITHRRQQPMVNSVPAHSFDIDNMTAPFREACFYALAEAIAPGLVTDVHIVDISASVAGIAVQVKKRRVRDEGAQREILASYLALNPMLQLAVAVDDDIDIYSAQDLLWAIVTRANSNEGIIKGVGRSPFFRGVTPAYDGRSVGIDATVPWNERELYERAHYPSDTVDLRRWVPEDKLAAARAIQGEYARILAKTGH